jgi:hypothetical protein
LKQNVHQKLEKYWVVIVMMINPSQVRAQGALKGLEKYWVVIVMMIKPSQVRAQGALKGLALVLIHLRD